MDPPSTSYIDAYSISSSRRFKQKTASEACKKIWPNLGSAEESFGEPRYHFSITNFREGESNITC